MKINKVMTATALALATAVALTACATSGTSGGSSASASPARATDLASLSGTITSGGSSAQANAEAAWTAAFAAQATGVTVNYDKSQGSGGGVTNWLGGSYDFAGSDVALSPAQQTQSKGMCGAGGALDIPAYLSGVAIIFNLPGIKSLKLDSATIAKIFTKEITRWNDPAIEATNPGVTFPTSLITPVVHSEGAGTTANFTSYLHDWQPQIWTSPVSTAWPISGESAQQGNSGVVATVAAAPNTIGYADQGSIGSATSAQIQVGTSNNFVAYSAKGATNSFAAAASTTPSTKGDLTQALDYLKLTNKDSYPIPLLSYQILCTKFASHTQATLTKDYVAYAASSQGQAVAAKNVGSAPLPVEMQSRITTSLALVK
jgi:phosphate transport system substrate-binding protein